MVDSFVAPVEAAQTQPSAFERPGSAPPPGRYPAPVAVALLVASVVLYLSWQLFRWLPGGQQLIGDAFFLPITVVAIAAAWRASQRSGGPGRLRSSWRLIALAWSAFLGGAIAQLVYELQGVKPYPSIADGLYLAFYPLMLWGLLRFPTARRTSADRVRLTLDLATTVIGGCAVVWYVVLGPTALAAGQSTLEAIFSVAYPVGDMVLIVGLASLLLRRPPACSYRALALMAAGLALFVVADLIYGNATLHGTYQGGDSVDSLWIVAITVAAVAGLAQRPLLTGAKAPPAEDDAGRREQSSWLPYLAVSAGGLLLIVSQRHQHFFPTFSLILTVVLLMALVSARQFLANRDLHSSDRALRTARDELSVQASTDALTGLPNHRALVSALDSELERSVRYGRPFAVAFLDVDHFKTVNDRHGHLGGDGALQEFAQVIPSGLRAIDIVGRWGGEEFIAVLPEVDAASALAIAERVRGLVASHPFQSIGGTHLTCSIGVAAFPEHGTSCDELLACADGALYTAKHLGRDQALLAGVAARKRRPTTTRRARPTGNARGHRRRPRPVHRARTRPR